MQREMEEAKAMAQQQQQQQHQQQLLLQQQQQQQRHQQQHQQQQQMLLLQQLQKQQQQQQQQAAISRFPSNIDAHLRPPGLLHRPTANLPSQPNSNPSPNPNPKPNPNPSLAPSLQNPNLQSPQSSQQQQQQQSQQQQQQQQQQKVMRPNNQAELQMAYQDAWRVCHPDFKRPFANLEDACERLLPYHVVADYEAEEDDRILDSDTTGQMPSRSQQWDHNIAVKVAEFTATFEKQALAFNIITRKRAMGEFRSEERLMVEQALLQDEKRAMLELRAQIESREKAGRDAQEAKLRMAAMAQAEQARAESQVHAEMMARGPIRANAIGSQGSVHIDHLGEQEQGGNPHEVINGWGNTAQRDEKEPSEDFLNDEETENGDTGMQGEWREVGEFDLNTR